MKRNLFYLLLCVIVTLSLCVVGCTKPDDGGNNSGGGTVSDDIIVTTYAPVDVTASTAVCGGSVQVVQGLALTKIGICWSTSPNPTADGNQLSSEAWNEPFVRTLTGLSANTVYHVRAFALRGLEYYYGQDKTFTTLSEGGGGGNGGGTTPTLPVVTTLQMTDITQTTAVGGGYITDDGGATVLERGICWSTSSNPTVSSCHSSNGSGMGNYTITIADLMPNMTYHVRAYATNSAGTGYGNDVCFTTLQGGGNYNGHDYVDLGLPSGTLWATCNIGASVPEDYGKYYAWGETVWKSSFNWNTYKYSNGSDDLLTKYCNQTSYGYNGFTDNLTVLQPMDDAATANWGSGWCLPSKDQWQELIDNTTNNWTSQKGVNGILFTATNGSTLFLPAAGSMSGNVNLDGRYWSTSLNLSAPRTAWYLCIYSQGAFMSNMARYKGLSVRPVHSSSQK